MCYRALQLQRRGGAYVIGHSLGARLPERLPKELGGGELPITYHSTIAKLERGLRRRPARWHILAPPPGSEETADDLLRFSLRLATELKKRAWQKLHPFKFWNYHSSYKGVHSPPIVVIIDEGIAIEAAGTSRREDNRWFLQYLYSLRHNHIGLLYSIQDPSARSWRILEQATEIWAFVIRHRWALECLRAAGAADVDAIARLPPHEHVSIYSVDSGEADLDFRSAAERARGTD